MDYFDGTEEDMKTFLGATLNPPIIPTHEEKVEILWKEYLKGIL
jgi:phage portal protein BeeE